MVLICRLVFIGFGTLASARQTFLGKDWNPKSIRPEDWKRPGLAPAQDQQQHGAQVPAQGATGARKVPRYEINLDLEPRLRFWDVVQENKRDIATFVALFATESALASRGVTKAMRAEWLQHHNFPADRIAELQGIVDAANSPKVTLENMIMLNLAYSLSAFHDACSGVLAMDDKNHVIHGRNLDYQNMHYILDMHVKDLQSLTSELVYTRHGRPIYVSVGILGVIGAHTGMKLTEPRWAFQQNTHHLNDRVRNLAAAKEGGVDFGFFWRDLLEEQVDYDAAIQRVKATNFNSPQYFVLSGQKPWQGVSMTIQRGLQQNESMVQLSEQENRWFLVQTNDPIQEPPRDPRRPAGLWLMAQMGRHRISKDNMLGVMRSYPLFKDDTQWTFMSVPATGEYETVLRNDNRISGYNISFLMRGTDAEKQMLSSPNLQQLKGRSRSLHF